MILAIVLLLICSDDKYIDIVLLSVGKVGCRDVKFLCWDKLKINKEVGRIELSDRNTFWDTQ